MKIGTVETVNNLFLAPMAGVTDFSFRTLFKKMGVGLLYTEMVSIKGLYYNDEKTKQIMKTSNEENPIALQIFGSDPEIFREVITDKLNTNNEFNIIDINFGCPAPKIVKNGDGSALMKDPKQIGKIVREAVKVSNKPVTAKIRKGWDNFNVNCIEIGKILESEGISAITIHGRTREEFYSGKADWDIIRELKRAIKVPVIGNGDIFDPIDIKNMMAYTECDGVMIGRGARGNPWIFERGEKILRGMEAKEPKNSEKIEMALKHFKVLLENKEEIIALKEVRKHIGWYLKGIRGSSEVKNRINKTLVKEEIEDILLKYKNNI